MLQDSLHVCMHMTALACSQFQDDCQPIGKVIVCESLSPQLARLLQKVLGKHAHLNDYTVQKVTNQVIITARFKGFLFAGRFLRFQLRAAKVLIEGFIKFHSSSAVTRDVTGMRINECRMWRR